jgi:hypothetical protein
MKLSGKPSPLVLPLTLLLTAITYVPSLSAKDSYTKNSYTKDSSAKENLAQDSSAVSDRLIGLAQRAVLFNHDYAQEKVYLHFDNTGYFLGETIWFKAYVVKADDLAPTGMSKTLYVELLTQEGNVIESHKLKIERGSCHGDFFLSDSLKAGFYEVRAYTRCMLNFGEEVIFSRVFPVYDAPENEGDFTQRNQTKRKFTIPEYRKKTPRLDNMNVSFYPEGGSLVAGIDSRVAFKATDKQGKSLEVTGNVLNAKGEEVCSFNTMHNGMGLFPILPSTEKYTVLVQHEGRKQKFDLPLAEPSGYVLSTFNLSPKILRTLVQRSADLSGTDSLALVLTCRGRILDLRIITVPADGLMLTFDKSKLTDGVCQLTLYDVQGRIRSERLVYLRNLAQAGLSIKTNKDSYQPYERIELDISTINPDGSPVSSTLSLAVRDGETSNFGNSDDGNILTDLLLSSDLKGYIESPAWYFEEQNNSRSTALDLLMMTQGWRRYSWSRMEGLEPFKAPHPIEEGILMDGRVLSNIQKKPMKDIDLIYWMIQGEKSYRGECLTDSAGNFNFLLDMEGPWTLNLQTKNEDKRKEYRILLNRAFSPTPRNFSSYDKEIWTDEALSAPEVPVDSAALLLGEVKYSTEVTPTNPEGYKEFVLKEVVKTEKRKLTWEQQAAREASVSYDVGKVSDFHRDIGESEASSIIFMLQEENQYFSIFYDENNTMSYSYKGRPVRFIIRDVQSELSTTQKIEELQQDQIEKVYIVEDRASAKKFYPTETTDPVLIFLVPFKDWKRRREPIGIRTTRFYGYSVSKAFYAPVYNPKSPIVESDHRRTLYWNPDLITDDEGKVRVSFSNNGTCKKWNFSVEGFTKTGALLTLKSPLL